MLLNAMKPPFARLLLATALLTGVLSSPLAATPDKETNAAGLALFESKIRPMLAQHCYKCHSAKSGTPEGNLLLDSRDAARKG